MISLKNINGEKVVVELHSIGERVVENARKTMHSSAARIVTEAKLNAPIEDGELRESIHIEKDYGERGRLEITVAAGGVVNGVNVDDYVTAMHEGSYNLGPRSIQEQEADPSHIIGPKFLERAADTEEQKLESRMIAAIRRVIPK